MTALNREILVNTRYKTVVKFTYDGITPVAPFNLTGQMRWSDYSFRLNDTTGATASDSRVDITRAFWSCGTGSMAVAWNNPSGSFTGTQFATFYSGNEEHLYAAQGFSIISQLTGASHDNGINIFNPTPIGNPITLILELDKVSGFGPTG